MQRVYLDYRLSEKGLLGFRCGYTVLPFGFTPIGFVPFEAEQATAHEPH